jgi:hypothetical protein
MKLGLRQRGRPAVAILVPRGHLSDFARRRDRLLPRSIYIADTLADTLATHSVKADAEQPDAHLYDLRRIQ